MPDTYKRVTHSQFRLLLDTLSPRYVQTGIATLLAAAGGKIVSTPEIVEWLYGKSVNCQPVIPHRNIRIAICKLRGAGLPIITHRNRGYSYGA